MHEIILSMNKYALVGKNISHSLSPEIYRKLISLDVEYDLLDYENEFEIPSAAILLNEYNGINITSPYKKHFLEQSENSAISKKIGAINCMKIKSGRIIGENTDYFAVVDILKKMKNEYGEVEIVILGDGVMANVAKIALGDLNLKFSILSRKVTKDFNQLNLAKCFQKKTALPLVINTCARDFIFNGTLPIETVFWDFNYNFSQHSTSLPKRVFKYIDGLDMLERQAFYAVSFWSS